MLSGLLVTKQFLRLFILEVWRSICMHVLALDRIQTAKDNKVDIEVELIPRTQNERTDYSSEIVDYDDCTVKNWYFRTPVLFLLPDGAVQEESV